MRIRKCILTVLFLPLVAGCHKVSHVSEEVVVNLRQKGTDISSSMYGVFSRKSITLVMEACMRNWYRTEVLKKMKSLKGIE